MQRLLLSLVAITTLLVIGTRSPSFGAELSSAGTETGIAACYNRRLKGHRTSSGQRYNPDALTAGHAKIPLGQQVKVTNLENGKEVVVTVNDHMSAHAGGGRIIMDISQRACKELGFPRSGESKVKIQVVSSSSSANSP
jgi:rare lipoprotein A